jgi:hypothetical protein
MLRTESGGVCIVGVVESVVGGMAMLCDGGGIREGICRGGLIRRRCRHGENEAMAVSDRFNSFKAKCMASRHSDLPDFSIYEACKGV